MPLKLRPGTDEDRHSSESSLTPARDKAGRSGWGNQNAYLGKNVAVNPRTMLGIFMLLCSNAGLVAGQAESGLPYPCDSNVYCYGNLLHTVQMARVYNDSKHFVDMPMKFDPLIVHANFQKLMEDTADSPSTEQVRGFVSSNFNEPGAEFEAWTPDDWVESPAFLNKVHDDNYRQFAATLVALWKDLGRKISPVVAEAPQKNSQIFVDNPFVVPGGRFREFYYWDSYWTIDGLLLSEMNTTVRGMLLNFVQMVQGYGLIPNGGRVYYLRRSQPPYLVPMVELYVNATGDLQFVRDNIAVLEQEFNFWMNNRSIEVIVNGSSYKLAQYNSRADGPRPESYREDYESAQNLSAEQQTQLYVEYKSGAESGWDYSSRWYKNNGTNKGTLRDLAVTHLAPVDLNSLLCYNARLLASYYTQLGDDLKAAELEGHHRRLLKAINDLFWDEEDGVWYDFDITTLQRRRYFYLSNLHPLWAQSYDVEQAEVVVERVITYLQQQGVLDYVGGVPTSTQNTGEQWDYPNAWAPLQHLAVMALQKSKQFHPDADDISFQLANKWVRSNWKGYEDTKAMFEKYNVNLVGNPGHGGEYEVQLGFGWTNGVALRFMNDFGDRLSSSIEPPSAEGATLGKTGGKTSGKTGGATAGQPRSVALLVALIAVVALCSDRALLR